MAELPKDWLDKLIQKGVTKALNEPILNGKSALEWAKIGMNPDRIEVVRCKDCIYRPHFEPEDSRLEKDLVFPQDDICPCQVGDNWYSRMPGDNWFCPNGKR